MKTTVYIRKATKDFVCSRCRLPIKKGTEYRDEETVEHDGETTIIKHVRSHLTEANAHLKYPDVVSVNGEKERVYGIVMHPHPVFLTMDLDKKYHFRQKVTDWQGNEHDARMELLQ